MMTKMKIFSHRPRVSLARFSFCWWCHNRLLTTSQWADNCDAITWIMISNSLDIDFIHGGIHGRWCKKGNYVSNETLDLNTYPCHNMRSAISVKVAADYYRLFNITLSSSQSPPATCYGRTHLFLDRCTVNKVYLVLLAIYNHACILV